MKRKTRFTTLFLAALLLLTPALALGEDDHQPQEEKVNAIEVLKEATELDLTPYEGKAIFMNFFTEWCPYCMEELPDIKKIYETYNADELQVILVHVWDGEDESNTESIKKTYGLEEMTFFEDKDRMLSYVMGLQGYPLSVFLAKDGTVHSGHGGMLDYDTMAAVMEELGVAKQEAAETQEKDDAQ